MKAHEIYHRISPALNEQILSTLFVSDKPAYKASVNALAAQRKLRPIFVERKPRPERHTWMHQAIGQKVSDEIALNLLQFWLLTTQQDILKDFLDALGVPHDGKGAVDELPVEPEKTLIASAIEILLARHPHEPVAVYLHTFLSMNDPVWTGLDELLASEPRLAFGQKTVE